MPQEPPLPRRLLAEFLGSAFLAAVVIGSGIAAANLSPGQTGLQPVLMKARPEIGAAIPDAPPSLQRPEFALRADRSHGRAMQPYRIASAA